VQNSLKARAHVSIKLLCKVISIEKFLSFQITIASSSDIIDCSLAFVNITKK
jgi:hypothetical protein